MSMHHKVTKKKQELYQKPWTTKDILDKCNQKDFILKKIAKENDPKIILTLKKEFKVLCNEITLEKRNSKKDHYNHFFEKNKQKSSETWKGIRIRC